MSNVPVEALEELADKMENPGRIKHPDACRCQEEWAKELRELIEEHKHE